MKPLIADDFSTGLRTDTTADKLPYGALARAENIRLLPDGGFGIRSGTQLVSTWDPGTDSRILNMEEMKELSVLFVNSGTKILVARDDESSLYTVGLTLTAAKSAFKEYDGAMKYTNGTDSYGSIAVALVKTQFTNADTRIYLNDGYGSKFTASGTVYVKGQSVTYTKAIGPTKTQTFTATNATETFTAVAHGLINGDQILVTNSGGALPSGINSGATYYVISATTDTFQMSLTDGGAAVLIADDGTGTHSLSCTRDVLTGCTIPSGTYEVGHVVTQTSTPSGAPRATVIESQFEKMMAAGVSTAKHAIYYSETASIDTPEDIDDFAGVGADQELYGKFGRITAMKSLLTKMYVAKDKGIEAWTGIDANGIPIREPFTDAYGVVNDRSIVVMGDRLCFYTGRRLKTIEPDASGADPEPVINPFFDTKIKGTLRQLDADQSDACMGYGDDELLRSTVFKDEARRTIVFDTVTGGFSVDVGYTPSCWVEYRGNVYFGSATTDMIYKADTGYTDGGVNPRMDVLSPIHYVGDRRRKVHVKEIYLTGVIKELTHCTVTIICDGATHRVFDLDGSADYVDLEATRPFGRDYLGRDPFGHTDGDDSADGYSFSVPIGINLDCRHVQIRFECQGTGYRVQIDSYEIVLGDSSTSETQEDSY